METSKWICPLCGGDNIDTKAWVSLNGKHVFIDIVSADEEDNWCDDCQKRIEPELINE